MDNEFTAAEIEEAITAARIFSPDYGREQFQALRELERRLAESGYPEAVCGLARLEKERGVACTEAMDTYEQLLQYSAELEQKVADSQATLEVIEGEVKQAQDKLHQLEEATKQAKAEREREEKELTAFRKKAEREKRGIERELEKCRQEANVAKEETVAAGRLKDQLAARGFTIEFTLDLCQEFVGREKAREELAKAIEEYGTLTKSNTILVEQSERLKSDLSYVQSEIDKGQANCAQLERISSELRAEIARNREIVDFYHRYLHLRPLIEYLGNWYVTFHHCNWCGCLFWILNPGKFNISARKCPWCGFLLVEPDRNAYATSGQPMGTAVKLLL